MEKNQDKARKGYPVAPMLGETSDHATAIIRLAIDAIANRPDRGASVITDLQNLSREMSALIDTAAAAYVSTH